MKLRSKSRFGILVFFSLALLTCAAILSRVQSAPDPAAVKIQGPDTLGNFGAWVIPPNQVNAQGSTATGAAINLTLPAVAGKTTYITGMCVSVNNPNASAGQIVVTIGSLAGAGTIQYAIGEVTTAPIVIVVNFSTPLAASAVNTAITVATSADATRAPNVQLSAWGFQY